MKENNFIDQFNHKLFLNKKLRDITILVASLFTCLLLTFIVLPMFYPYNPSSVRTSNLTPSSVTISWVTTKPTKGRVYVSRDKIISNYSLLISKQVNSFHNSSTTSTNYFIDDRSKNGQEPSLYTHHVTISNLEPETQYYFKISDGFILADYLDTNQDREWFEPPTLLSFNFTTPKQIDNVEDIRLPKQAFGDIQIIDPSAEVGSNNIILNRVSAQTTSEDSVDFTIKTENIEESTKNVQGEIINLNSVSNTEKVVSQDTIIYINAYQGDIKGNRSETNNSQYLSTTLDAQGNWVIDKTSFRDQNGKLFSELIDNRDYLYVYFQSHNYSSVPGEYFLVGSQDSPVPTRNIYSSSDKSLNIQLDLSNEQPQNSKLLHYDVYSQLLNYDQSNLLVKDAKAQTKGMCCILEIEGRNDLIGDWEDGDYCNSCQKCFEGRKIYDGKVTWIYTESSINDENACEKIYAKSTYEQIKLQQTELAQVAQAYGCNPNAPATQVDGLISRENYGKLAYTYFGIAQPTENKLNKAYTCYNHVVCSSVNKAVDPAIVLSLWLAHSGGGNGELTNNSYSEFGVKTDITNQDFDAQLSSIISQVKSTKCNTVNDPFARLSTILISPTKCDQNISNTYYFPASSLISETNLSPSDHASKISEIWPKISSNPQPKSSFEIDEIDCDYTEYMIKPVETEDSVCCAIKTLSSDVLIGQWTQKSSDCSKWKIGTTFEGSNIEYVSQVDIKSKSSCDFQEIKYSCEGENAKLDTTTIGQSNGNISSCLIGIISHPVENNTSKPHLDITNLELFSKYIITGNELTIDENGTYLVKLDDVNYAYFISNPTQKHRFYIEKNNTFSFQSGDTLFTPSQNIKIYKLSETSKLHLQSDFNFISFNFAPSYDGTNNINASEFLRIANTTGLLVKSITYFGNGKWENGVIYNPNVSSGYIGNDFTLKSGLGYVVTLYPEALNKTSQTSPVNQLNIVDGKVVIDMPSRALQGPSEINFSQGWNLVGVNGFGQNYQASGLLKNINKSQKVLTDNISYWNPKSSRYNSVTVIDNDEYGIDYQISPVESYFIRVSSIKTGKPIELWKE